LLYFSLCRGSGGRFIDNYPALSRGLLILASFAAHWLHSGRVNVRKAGTFISALWLLGLLGLLACGQVGASDAQQAETLQDPATAQPAPIDLSLSLGVSPTDTGLEEILSGMKQVSLSPIVTDGFSIVGRPQEKHWLRMKVTLPADAQSMILSFERQGVRSITLYQVDKSGKKTSVIPLQSSRAPHLENTRGQWPTRIIFLLPPAVSDGAIVYAEIESLGYVQLHPMLLSSEQQTLLSAADDSFFGTLYFSILVLIALTTFRQLRMPESQAILISLCLIIGVAGFFAYNTHLPLFLKTEFINKPSFPYAMLILAAAPFLSASNYFTGLHSRWPEGAMWVTRCALALLVFAVFVALGSMFSLTNLQIMTAVIWTICIVMAMCIYLFDVRSSRWSALIVAGALLAGLWAPSFVYTQTLPPTQMNLYGFQVFFLMLMAVYLLLPWLRSGLQNRGRKRRIMPAPELTAGEKIANARLQLTTSLQTALQNANEGDVEWIAYRRLLEGLKPVLPQLASAVIAKNYHNEDLLIVEPKSATDRYAALINHRGNLLKNLSRMTAPQQIRLDFDGPEGPLQVVSLAVIPLPIAKPGWGALIVERTSDRNYSEHEMDVGAEFAALATTAGDEAAEAMLSRHAKEMDTDTGLYNREKFDEIIKRLLEASVLQQKQLSLLRISIDNFSDATNSNPVLKTEVLQSLVAAMRDEVDYGVTMARFDSDDCVVLMPDKNIGQAREQAQRLCNIASRIKAASVPAMNFTLSVGVSHLQPGERTSKMMLDRTAAALAKARQYGGNQIQAISSGTL
jgi:diguanylate cyclase (GGDEF)-like protein